MLGQVWLKSQLEIRPNPSIPVVPDISSLAVALRLAPKQTAHPSVQFKPVKSIGYLCAVQALQEAKIRSEAATAEVQRISKEVKRLEVGIPKLQLEAAAARHQSTDLQQRLTQLAQAAQVHCMLAVAGSEVL